MAPAIVLFLMTALLCFIQFTYWDLSVKRQQAKDLKTAFIALAEADMATQRMQNIVALLSKDESSNQHVFEQMANIVRSMLKKSLDALINLDPSLARDICTMDDRIDDIHDQTYKKIEILIDKNPGEAPINNHSLDLT